MPERPPPSLFSPTSAFTPIPSGPGVELPAVPADLVVGRITAEGTALRKVAEVLELARAATTDTDMLPLLDEALDLARQYA